MKERRKPRYGARIDAFTPPIQAARAAALRYVSAGVPGIRREGAPGAFHYAGPDGKPVTDDATLRRIRSLAIPPAWTGVWIGPDPFGHLQATGRDARGRKQYRYHPRWREVRDESKYERMAAFGAALPRIRARVERDLARPGLPREKVLATLVRLLDATGIRVGNEEYARANKSFGLTTLKNRHVEVQGERLTFRFRGKGGKQHDVKVTDRRLARLVRRIRDLPGQDLFQYVNGEGAVEAISSGDVNAYLRAVSREEFTAKDFRTWAGTLAAARGLSEAEDRPVKEVVSRVAEQLGNTAAIAKKCYIHPLVLDAWRVPAVREHWRRGARRAARRGPGLSGEERALLAFLAEPPVNPLDAPPAPAARRARGHSRPARRRARTPAAPR